jgi:hypothetical protein
MTRTATDQLLDQSAASQGAAINGSVAGQYIAAAEFPGNGMNLLAFQVGREPADQQQQAHCLGGKGSFFVAWHHNFLSE